MKKVDFFNSGPNRLSCVFTVPDDHVIEAGLVFVHAADGNRLGPHKMFVEMSERLKYCGIVSLRFDLRGCGDSEGEPAGYDINPDIEDLLSAIRFFASRYRPPKIFFFGISRGSQVSISTLSENELAVDGAVLLSTPFAGSKAAAKKFSNRLKEYMYKFQNSESLRKFLTGKANLKQIAKTLVFALNSQKRYRRNSNSFITRCPLLFIYGSKDPMGADSAIHYSRLCEKFKIPFKIVEIKNANHSFFHYRWKEQILEVCEKWLIENIRGKGDDSLL